MITALFWVIRQRVVGESLPTFRDNLSGHIYQESVLGSLKMRPIFRTETSGKKLPLLAA